MNGITRVVIVATLLLGVTATAEAQNVRANTHQSLTRGHTTQNAAWVILRHPVFSQQMPNWCWVATISNAWAAQGHRVEQHRLVEAVYGTIADVRSGQPSNVTSLLNSKFVTDDDGKEFSSTVTGLYDSIDRTGTGLSNADIIQSLTDNIPVVMMTTTHSMLVVGMEYVDNGGGPIATRVEVFDPYPGQGFRFLGRDEMLPLESGGTLMYVATIRID